MKSQSHELDCCSPGSFCPVPQPFILHGRRALGGEVHTSSETLSVCCLSFTGVARYVTLPAFCFFPFTYPGSESNRCPVAGCFFPVCGYSSNAAVRVPSLVISHLRKCPLKPVARRASVTESRVSTLHFEKYCQTALTGSP